MCLLWPSDLIVGRRRDSRKASRGVANYSAVSDKREEEGSLKLEDDLKPFSCRAPLGLHSCSSDRERRRHRVLSLSQAGDPLAGVGQLRTEDATAEHPAEPKKPSTEAGGVAKKGADG